MSYFDIKSAETGIAISYKSANCISREKHNCMPMRKTTTVEADSCACFVVDTEKNIVKFLGGENQCLGEC